MLALATTTGLPAVAACSTAERQAPLPPQAAGSDASRQSPTSSATRSGGVSVPLTAGRGAPTSGPAGRDVAPGSADSGGLRPRPANVPGTAGSASSVPSRYRIGTRAPWGLLLGDAPQPAPHQAGVGGNHDGEQPGERVPLPQPASGGGAILADGAHPAVRAVKESPAVKLSAARTSVPAVAPGPAKQDQHTNPAHKAPEQGLPASISFSSLLSVLPPSATRSGQAPHRLDADEERSGKRPKGAAPEPEHSAYPAKHGSSSPTGRPAPAPLPTPLPSTTPAHAPRSAPQPLAPQPPKPQPPIPQPPKLGPDSPTPPDTGWHIDGLVLPNAAPPGNGNAGSPRFRKALDAALAARPHGQRPEAAALRRWSATVQKAASLAPDPGTKAQLHTLARYVRKLADTPGPKRAALQAKRPAAIKAASALRSSLPQRFGVRLLD